MIACRKSFTDTLLELARQDKDIVVVTTDARGSVTLGDFAKELPAQFVECGIAEQDAVGISAGLAHSGKKVFVCGPACFYVARSLEQVKVDLAYSQNNVKILGVSGGVAYGALGATHHSLHDIAVLRTFPGMNIVLPCDARQTRKLVKLLVDYPEPVYVRVGRAAVPDVYENDDFDFVYEHLADEKSKKDYIDILNFKVSGKVDYLLNSFCDKESIYRNILKLSDSESIVDLGAYDGDTIREFTAYTKGKYNKIIALEPDAKSYKKLIKNTAEMKNLETYNMGAWNEKDTLIFAKEQSRNSHISASGVPVKVTDIDSLIDCPVTMIKMDIEGSEMKALDGAKRIIKTYLPKLYVCAYHRNEDLFALGKKILSLNDKYKLYFRHSVYIPAWESNFYAVIS